MVNNSTTACGNTDSAEVYLAVPKHKSVWRMMATFSKMCERHELYWVIL